VRRTWSSPGRASRRASPAESDYSIRSSDDRGQTWTTYPITLRKDERELILLGVDPTNPDRVFGAIHVCREDESCLDRAIGLRKDTLLVSDDRGRTWTTLMELGEVAGFELDESTLWVGDWQGNTLGNPACPIDPLAVATVDEICEPEWTDLCRECFFDDPVPPEECSEALLPADGGPFPGLPGVADAAGLPEGDAGPAVRPEKKESSCSLAANGNALSSLALLGALALRRRRGLVRTSKR
jgi:hypothetical protein